VTGRIHDLGYQRYVGTRRPPSTRWIVIMRHQIATAWKTWWRYKTAIALAVIVTFVFGGYMYFSSEAMSRLATLGGGGLLKWVDAALPQAIENYCRVAFYVTLTIGAGAIAGDVQTGAFTFYFARSVRPRDYVLGKLVGFATLVGAITIGGPLVLALIRLGVCDSWDEVVAHLSIVPEALAVGVLATLVYATVPLAFSALVPNRRTALALWAAYYLVFGAIAQRVGATSGGEYAMIDLLAAVRTVGYHLFGIAPARGWGSHWGQPVGAALVSIGIHSALAISIVWWRVTGAQKAGVGGAS